MKEKAAEHPTIASIVKGGESHEKREILGIKIEFNPVSTTTEFRDFHVLSKNLFRTSNRLQSNQIFTQESGSQAPLRLGL